MFKYEHCVVYIKKWKQRNFPVALQKIIEIGLQFQSYSKNKSEPVFMANRVIQWVLCSNHSTRLVSQITTVDQTRPVMNRVTAYTT